jgi:hypothetical protein
VLHINSADVRIVQQGDRYTGHLGRQAVGYSANGEMQRTAVNTMDLKWNADEFAKVTRDGIEWTEDIDLGGKAPKVRFVVFDRDSHAVGSLTMPGK